MLPAAALPDLDCRYSWLIADLEPSALPLDRFHVIMAAMMLNVNEYDSLFHKSRPAQELDGLEAVVSGVAHDFNNLLTTMLTQTNLALAKLPPEDPARLHLTRVVKTGERAAGLAYQLVSYVQGHPLRLDTVNLNQLALDTLEMLEDVVIPTGSVRLDLQSSLPLIKADPEQVRQVIMNLLINAAEEIVDYQGRITVTTGCQKVAARDSSDKQPDHFGQPAPGVYVYLQVSDNGRGIDQKALAQIFQPFFSTKSAGRGLGLTIALSVLKAHRGGMMVESAPGGGATFKALFPQEAFKKANRENNE